MKNILLNLSLTLTAVIMWSLLPIALQPVLAVMDSQTVVWFRFVVAAVGVFIFLLVRQQLPAFRQIRRPQLALLAVGILGISGNFYLFNLALNHIPATACQVLSPMSSFLLMFIGVFIFKEPVGTPQKIGFGVLLVGLLLFFNDRFDDFAQFNDFALGIILAASASALWLGYAIAQKILIKRLSAAQILLGIYFGSALLMTPTANPTQVSALGGGECLLLIFCCLNTLIAYGSYAEAILRWDLNKISVVMTLIPIFTIAFAHLAHGIFPEIFTRPEINALSYVGAIIVVSGALLAVLGRQKETQ